MNERLLDLVESGRIGTEAALKKAFRALAKRVHPDAKAEAGSRAQSLSFIALKTDFEAALARLQTLDAESAASREPGNTLDKDDATASSASGRARDGPGAPSHAKQARPETYAFDRRALYENLEDLLARGFPEPPKTAFARRNYERSLKVVLAYLAGRDEIYPEDRARAAFIAFRAVYSSLPSGGFLDVDNDARRGLYMFLSNLIGFHRRGFRHEARTARGLFPVVEESLRGSGATGALPFLRFLLADLDRGPAMPD